MPDGVSDNEEYINAKLEDVAAKKAEVGARKPNESLNYMALKYTFAPTRGDMGGAFCMIFEGATGEVVYKSLWITRPYVQKAFKPSRDWRSFTKLFPQFGPYEKLAGDKLNTLLDELLPIQDRLDIFEDGTNSSSRRLTRVEAQIRKGFERATGCFFEVACEVELLTRGDLERAQIIERPAEPENEEKTDENDETEKKERSFEGTVVLCIPVVDPVWGKPVSQVEPGDILEVKIEGETGPSGLVHKYLESTGQKPTFPVEVIERREDKTFITLRISDEIEGHMTLTKDLRLKAKHTVKQREQQKHGVEDLIFFGVMLLAGIGLLLAIRYFFL